MPERRLSGRPSGRAKVPRLPIGVRYVPRTALASTPPDRAVLAAIGFTDATAIDGRRPGHIDVGLPQLMPEPMVELWTSDSPVAWHVSDGWTCGTSNDVLFGYCLVDDATAGLEATTFAVYQRLLALLQREGFPQLMRIWHYFPRIHDAESGLERYQAFNRGRSHALETVPGVEARLPASTAIGTNCPGLLVYFLASRLPVTPIENPRQISASHYPTRYGPRPPAFSRAALAHWGLTAALFVSGTASIVGHETAHEQHALAQLDETLVNIDALLQRARHSDPSIPPCTGDLSVLKFYVRHPADHAALQQHLAQKLRPQPPTLFLRGDVCREDLLLEIEGAYLQ